MQSAAGRLLKSHSKDFQMSQWRPKVGQRSPQSRLLAKDHIASYSKPRPSDYYLAANSNGTFSYMPPYNPKTCPVTSPSRPYEADTPVKRLKSQWIGSEGNVSYLWAYRRAVRPHNGQRHVGYVHRLVNVEKDIKPG